MKPRRQLPPSFPSQEKSFDRNKKADNDLSTWLDISGVCWQSASLLWSLSTLSSLTTALVLNWLSTMGKKNQTSNPFCTNLKPTASLPKSVASIHFTNGSNVDVAKIEGSPTSKQLMCTTDVKNDHIYIAPFIDIGTLGHAITSWLSAILVRRP